MTTKTEHSTNERAEKLLGRRDEQGPIGIILFSPVEQGYWCPVHQIADIEDVSLQWSEYSAFVWCAHCDRDYPSALCVSGTQIAPERLGRAVEIYLDTVESALARAASRHSAQNDLPHTNEDSAS